MTGEVVVHTTVTGQFVSTAFLCLVPSVAALMAGYFDETKPPTARRQAFIALGYTGLGLSFVLFLVAVWWPE